MIICKSYNYSQLLGDRLCINIMVEWVTEIKELSILVYLQE